MRLRQLTYGISGVLSVASMLVLVDGFLLFLHKGIWFLPTACLEGRLMFVAAPLLSLASLVTGLVAGRGADAWRYWRIVFRTLAVSVLVFDVLLTLPPWMLPFRLGCSQPSGESLALRELQSLNQAIGVYKTMYQSLPVGLDQLHIQEESRADEQRRGWQFNYTVTYTLAPPEADGAVRRYTIVARPNRYGEDGTQNFFTDETEVIRFTTQDRPATAHDCRVEDWQACKP